MKQLDQRNPGNPIMQTAFAALNVAYHFKENTTRLLKKCSVRTILLFVAKTCDGCQKKIIDETLIATNSGKHFHKDCYNNGQ